MTTIRRTIPRNADALAALRAGPSAARSGAPGWLAAAAVAGAATLVAPTIAKADPGSIRLRNGGRVRGDVVAVLPNDRAVVMLPDGTAMTIPWADILFVFDGARVYDSMGNTTEIEAPQVQPTVPAGPAAPAATAPAAQATPNSGVLLPGGPATAGLAYRSGAMDADALNEYSRMPRRGPTAVLFTFGGLFTSNAVLNLAFGAIIKSDGYDYGDAGRALLISGSLTLGMGALMLGFGGVRAHRRNEAIDRLRSRGYFVAGMHDALELSFDADIAPGRFVPRVGFRF